MKSYCIADSFSYSFKKIDNLLSYNSNIDFISYRDKNGINYTQNAIKFLDIVSKYNVRSILHSNIDIVLKLRPYGIHLTSKEFCHINLAKEAKLYTIISTHNEFEIIKAIEYGADAITFSPIFKSPNKGVPLGICKLKEVVKNYSKDIDIFALGGIVGSSEIQYIDETSCFGFASIRYFLD